MSSDMNAMEFIDIILSRRSVRQYSTEAISSDHLQMLLKAAMQAPSARNTQSWQYVLIDQREKMQRITEFHPYAGMLNQAALAITVCTDLKLEPSLEYGALNCAAATENILLAAHAQGLGAVWLGIYPRESRMADLAKLLQLPATVIPISLVALGYPAEEKGKEIRFNTERIHYNSW